MSDLTIEQLEFARKIGATHFWGGTYYKSGADGYAAFYDYDGTEWVEDEGYSDPNGIDSSWEWEDEKINFSPLDNYYAKGMEMSPTCVDDFSGLPEMSYDNVKNPKHYQLLPGVEVKDVRKAILDNIETNPTLYAVDCWSRSWEYLTRMWGKNGLEDAKKARVYLDWLIAELEKDAENV